MTFCDTSQYNFPGLVILSLKTAIGPVDAVAKIFKSLAWNEDTFLAEPGFAGELINFRTAQDEPILKSSYVNIFPQSQVIVGILEILLDFLRRHIEARNENGAVP